MRAKKKDPQAPTSEEVGAKGLVANNYKRQQAKSFLVTQTLVQLYVHLLHLLKLLVGNKLTWLGCE